MIRHCLFTGLCSTAVCISASAQSVIAYDEAKHGDLSDDHLAPGALTLGSGSNAITGTIGRSPTPDVPDLDYVTLTVPAGQSLERLVLLSIDVGGAYSFIGVQEGPVIGFPYTEPDVTELLGWTHFGSAEQGFDVLPAIGAGSGAIGFTPPLGAGVYTFWFMELDTFIERPYTFEFVVGEAACRADFNGDGVVNSTDVSDLVNAWFADQVDATLRADFTLDGVSNSTDVGEFINAWFEEQGGC